MMISDREISNTMLSSLFQTVRSRNGRKKIPIQQKAINLDDSGEHFTLDHNALAKEFAPGSHCPPGSRQAQQDAFQDLLTKMDLERAESEGGAESEDSNRFMGGSHRYPGAHRPHQKAFEEYMSTSDYTKTSSDSDNISSGRSQLKRGRKPPKKGFRDIAMPKLGLCFSKSTQCHRAQVKYLRL
jgi:hypothetical protein